MSGTPGTAETETVAVKVSAGNSATQSFILAVAAGASALQIATASPLPHSARSPVDSAAALVSA